MAKAFDLSKYTDVQIAVARMLCDPEADYSVAKVAKEIGVTDRTIYRWKLDADFIDLMEYVGDMYMKSYVSNIDKAVMKGVKNGSVKSMELGYKRAGKLVDRKEVVSDVTIDVSLNGKSNDQLLAEIADLERKLALEAATKAAAIEIDAVIE